VPEPTFQNENRCSLDGNNLSNSGDEVILKNGSMGTRVKRNTINTLPSSIGKHANGVVY
jgi:hypothetical protein